jgi:putative DNA primase/helicase
MKLFDGHEEMVENNYSGQLHEAQQESHHGTFPTGQVPNLLGYDADDEGNARAIRALHGQHYVYCGAYGWMYYTGTHWERENAEVYLERATSETLRMRRVQAVQAHREDLVAASKPNASHVKNAKFLLHSHLLANVADFDASPDHLNVANGVLDLRTGTLEPHHPEQRFTYCVPVEYDPEASTDEWLAWLHEVVGGGEEVINYLQEATGYSLTGHTREEKLHYVYGPTRSGKGTFTETLLALLPKQLAIY